MGREMMDIVKGLLTIRTENQLEDDETDTILGLTENFVMCKLPGGAGNDSGSYGVMTIDVLNARAVWNFHWNDGLDFFSSADGSMVEI